MDDPMNIKIQYKKKWEKLHFRWSDDNKASVFPFYYMVNMGS